MTTKTFEEKVDDAVHAAMAALGLSVEENLGTAEVLNDHISEVAWHVMCKDDGDE